MLQFVAIVLCTVYGEGSELGSGQVMSSSEMHMLCVVSWRVSNGGNK